jgi:hypothetical protein
MTAQFAGTGVIGMALGLALAKEKSRMIELMIRRIILTNVSGCDVKP